MLVSLVAVVVEVAVKRSNIYWTMALVLTLGSLVGSAVAGRLLLRLPERGLRVVFAGCLAVASYRILTGGFLGADSGVMTLSDGSALAYLAAVPIGFIAGVTSTLFGIGGGIVTVPCLSLLFRDVSFHAARATSLTTILPTSAFGAWQHQRLGIIDFAVVRGLVPSALLGSGIGVVLVNILPPHPGRVVFGIFLALVAAKLLLIGRAQTSSPAVLTTNSPAHARIACLRLSGRAGQCSPASPHRAGQEGRKG